MVDKGADSVGVRPCAHLLSEGSRGQEYRKQSGGGVRGWIQGQLSSVGEGLCQGTSFARCDAPAQRDGQGVTSSVRGPPVGPSRKEVYVFVLYLSFQLLGLSYSHTSYFIH